ncbi:SRPBCC family protein [Confluentibacter flavum]|uniref:Polyketide cyclase n=1 Tax=Confluentibacter flavum TaxID=1909700 RepID=A0A2N3HMW2_9FLAO|nr:SRPBCC family protein [Confluentibacter flavum]PKQ46309.1 polyketide cyclase [Confluentibacter flavum]
MFFFFGILMIAITLFILVIAVPKHFNISRNIVINKPANEVFAYLKFIKNQDDWSPWKKKDPNMKQSYVGTDGKIGFIAKWEGNKDVGSGEQEITRIVENEVIETKLRFYKPWKSESDAYIKIKDLDKYNSTIVTWGFSGKNKTLSSIFFLLFNVEKAIGEDFENGLVNLKKMLEE